MIDPEEILEYLNAFGVNLRKRRNELKLSYEDVTKRAGIAKSILSRVENGQNAPSFETFLRLHLALGVTTDFFRTQLIRPHESGPLFGMAFEPGGRIDVEEATQA